MKNKFYSTVIDSVSSCVPKKKLDLNTFGSVFGINEVKKIIKSTGISEVRVADKNVTASDLCEKAAEHLLTKRKINRNEVGGLIFVSQTRDYELPQTSQILQHKLGLDEDCICYDLPIGCSGYIYGLYQSMLLIESSSAKKVLLLVGETNSRFIDEMDQKTKLVFGDAGTATLLTNGVNESNLILRGSGLGFKNLIIENGGYRKNRNSSEKFIKMNGLNVFNFTIDKVPKIINDILSYSSSEIKDVDRFFFHQANNFMVKHLYKKLKIEVDKVPCNMNKYGNTGGASIPLLLSESHSNESLEKIILCGFGVGLSWGAILTNLSKTFFLKPIDY
tara:strand:- start:15254 stop:16252 length:999 start_codon:yes stop_codon:yes gene_type:complete